MPATPANAINESGASGLVNFDGTATFSTTPAAIYNVVSGAGANTIHNIVPTATSGVPIISQGSAAQPIFGTAVVSGGGTGAASFTAYAPLCGGTTTTGILQSAATGIGTSGTVLTSNGAAALPSFQALSGLAVTSITGTANQISASASTGAVTLSIPTTVAIGTSNTVSTSTQITHNATAAYNTSLVGTQTSLDVNSIQLGLNISNIFQPASDSTYSAAVSISADMAPASGRTISTSFGILVNPTFGNSGTVDSYYGVYTNFANGTTGSLTSIYGGFFSNPSYGSGINVALYSDDVSVGYESAAPTNGLIVSGISGFGTSSPNSVSQVTVSSTLAFNILMNGIQAATDSGNSGGLTVGLNVSPTFRPTPGAGNAIGLYSSCTFAALTSKTISTAAAMLIYNNYGGNAGTITTAYGIFVNTGGAGAGTITTSYGLYCSAPTAGSTKIAMYTDNLAVGYAGVAPPSSGMIVSGQVGIGTSAPNSGAVLHIQGTVNNQYAYPLLVNTNLTPSGAGGQQFAIASEPKFIAASAQTITAACGLYVFNTVSSNVGTISTLYGILIDTTSSGAGTITNAYGLYCNTPICATNNYCAYFQGNVGIGTPSPTYAIHVVGTQGSTTSTLWTLISDAAIKKDIENVEEALPIINSLIPRKFRYTQEWFDNHDGHPEDKIYYGLVAQEVEKVIPSCIPVRRQTVGNRTGLKSLDMHNINILLIKAVQELSAEIKELKGKICQTQLL
jgi:hypothetical protein